MNREIRILFLDDTPFDGGYVGQAIARMMTEFAASGIEASITAKQWTTNAFCPTPEELAVVDEMCHERDFDAIIIGNNVRGGVPIAAAINPMMRGRIIIVSNSGHVPFPDEYIALGVTHFGRRLREVDAVMELLGIKRQ